MALAVALLNELSGLAGSLGVDDGSDAGTAAIAEQAPPVGDQANRPPPDLDIRAQQLRSAIGHEFHAPVPIHDAADNRMHIVGQAAVARQDLVKPSAGLGFRAVQRCGGRARKPEQ